MRYFLMRKGNFFCFCLIFFLEEEKFGQKPTILLLKEAYKSILIQPETIKKAGSSLPAFTTTIYKKTSLHDYLFLFNSFSHIDESISHSS